MTRVLTQSETFTKTLGDLSVNMNAGVFSGETFGLSRTLACIVVLQIYSTNSRAFLCLDRLSKNKIIAESSG